METIHFYNYNGDSKVINKNLSSPTDLDCTLWKTFDVLHPVLLVRLQAAPTFNYCKIDSLQRFYFVDSVKFIGNSTYEIFLSVDVLKTYETDILRTTGHVVLSDDPDKYISTRQSIYSRTPHFEKVPFPNMGLLNDTGTMIMITIKGNK
jgi:hypothetical protein